MSCEFEFGNGIFSEMATQILYNADQKGWTGIERSVYLQEVLKHLAAGSDVETAIQEVEVSLILANTEE